MKRVSLGESGIEVGAIAYGCWRLCGSSVSHALRKIETALDCGMTLIDTADIYGYGEPAGFGGAEALLGEVLAAAPALRGRMVLATKGGITPPTPYNGSADYLMQALDASLKRLRVDAVDLYQIHRPDLLTSAAETAHALDRIVDSGKARTVGLSNYTAGAARAVAAHMRAPLVSMQPEFSVFEQSPLTDGVLDWCAEMSAACLAWSPLAGGRLFGAAEAGGPQGRQARILQAVDQIAAAHESDRASVALAFLLRHPGRVIPIIGTQNPDRIRAAAQAGALNLDARQWYDLVEAYRGAPMP